MHSTWMSAARMLLLLYVSCDAWLLRLPSAS
jgi:hypothetical protein